MKHVLFVCSQNRLRSPTAEQIFSNRPGFEVASAGTDREAETPVSVELVEWADVIFVMERAHRKRLDRNFRKHLKDKRVVCLDIPDEYEFMDPVLEGDELIDASGRPALRKEWLRYLLARPIEAAFVQVLASSVTADTHGSPHNTFAWRLTRIQIAAGSNQGVWKGMAFYDAATREWFGAG